jgi:hypothetical protein
METSGATAAEEIIVITSTTPAATSMKSTTEVVIEEGGAPGDNSVTELAIIATPISTVDGREPKKEVNIRTKPRRCKPNEFLIEGHCV